MTSSAVMYGPHSQWSSEAGYKLFDKYAREPAGRRAAVDRLERRQLVSFVHGARITSSLKRTDAEFWQILDFEFLEGGPYAAADVAATASSR